jgi:hypothetical protein
MADSDGELEVLSVTSICMYSCIHDMLLRIEYMSHVAIGVLL